MEFFQKNKAVIIGIVAVLVIVSLILFFRKGKKKSSTQEKQTSYSRRYRGGGRRGRTSLRRRRTHRSSRKSRGRQPRKSKKKGKKEKKKKPKINLNLRIEDIPPINNKELIELKMSGKLIEKYDYTFLYNPYEDWMVRIYLVDTDGDGIPDKDDPDDDDDGFTDEEELKAGTDPKDYRSHPQIKKKEQPKKGEKEKGKEKTQTQTSQIQPQKKKITREEAILRNYAYKGVFGFRTSRIAILKDLKTGSVILKREGENIPGTKFIIKKVEPGKITVLNIDSGKTKDIYALAEKTRKVKKETPPEPQKKLSKASKKSSTTTQ